MSSLIILPSSNTKGKKDYTGAFLPESKSYAKVAGGPSDVVIQFDNTLPMPKRRKHVIDEIGKLEHTYSQIAIFSHGWSTGIQAGFDLKSCHELVEAIRECCFDDVVIALYCCSTGADPDDDSEEAPGSSLEGEFNLGEGSFADKMRDLLCQGGDTNCRIIAHRTAGHTTMNPHVIYFEGQGSPIGGIGGFMPVTPKNKKLWKKWVAALKTKFRFEYPRMTAYEIHEYLDR